MPYWISNICLYSVSDPCRMPRSKLIVDYQIILTLTLPKKILLYPKPLENRLRNFHITRKSQVFQHCEVEFLHLLSTDPA